MPRFVLVSSYVSSSLREVLEKEHMVNVYEKPLEINLLLSLVTATSLLD
jgi:hypothetical protein